MWGQPPSLSAGRSSAFQRGIDFAISLKRKACRLARPSRLYRSLRFTSTYYPHSSDGRNARHLHRSDRHHWNGRRLHHWVHVLRRHRSDLRRRRLGPVGSHHHLRHNSAANRSVPSAIRHSWVGFRANIRLRRTTGSARLADAYRAAAVTILARSHRSSCAAARSNWERSDSNTRHRCRSFHHGTLHFSMED
jgi:hypothetical protein